MPNVLNTYRNALNSPGASMEIPTDEKWRQEGAQDLYDYAGRVGRGEIAQEAGQRYANALTAGVSGDLTEDQFLDVLDIGGFGGIIGGAKSMMANMPRLTKAKKMARKGTDRAKIWNKTGWYQGPDGKWKYEIDDAGFKFSPENLADESYGGRTYKKGKFAEATEHPEATRAYPDLKEGDVVAYDWSGGDKAASYYPPSKILESPETITHWRGYDRPGSHLHEMQHGIQRRERFAPGGSPSSFDKSEVLPISDAWTKWSKNKKLAEKTRALHQSQQYQDELTASNKLWDQEYQPIYDELESTITTRNDYSAISNKIDDLFKSYDKVKKTEFPALHEVERVSKMGVRLDEPAKHIDSYEAYNRLAGEAEARMVQKRMNLTPEQRSLRPPWQDFDVPERNQLLRFE